MRRGVSFRCTTQKHFEGNRHRGIVRGDLLSDRDGVTHYQVVRKSIHDGEPIPAVSSELVYEQPLDGWFLRGVFDETGVKRDFVRLLDTLRSHPHTNVLGVLEWDQVIGRRDTKYHIFSPLCVGGSVDRILETTDCSYKPQWYRGSMASRWAFIQGAWRGLLHMHQTMGLLHGDIKPSNIFVHQCSPGGTPHAVLGDVDSALHMGASLGDDVYPIGTMCYGSPFPPGDWRGDAVALAVCTVLVVWGIDPLTPDKPIDYPHNDWWYATCRQELERWLSHTSLAEYWGWVPDSVLVSADRAVRDAIGAKGDLPLLPCPAVYTALAHRAGVANAMGGVGALLVALDGEGDCIDAAWPASPYCGVYDAIATAFAVDGLTRCDGNDDTVNKQATTDHGKK